jgi:hypothetical protein
LPGSIPVAMINGEEFHLMKLDHQSRLSIESARPEKPQDRAPSYL